MTASRILAITLRQFYLFRGSPARVLPLFAWVAIDIVLWGFITKYLNAVTHTGLNFVPLLLGAVLLWDFLTRVMQGVTTAFFEDVWTRNFLNLFSTPLTLAEYITGLVLTGVLTSAFGLAAMVVLASLAFGLSFLIYGAMLAPFLLILFVWGVALGVAASGIVLRFGPAAEWFIWPIPALLSPFAGVFYPLSTLPAWMRVIARTLPASYVFEGMRAGIAHQSVSAAMLLSGACLAAVYLAAASWIFTSIYRHALRTGLIARYSAESVS
jgi:ABC-2 type transport system permease protein